MARIIDMVNRVSRYGTLRPNKYKIEFVGTSIAEAIKGYYSLVPRENGTEGYENRLSLSCRSFTMPGRGVSTSEYKTRGLLRKVPYGRIYTNECSATLILGAEAFERKVFENWMDSIVDPLTGKFSYYDDYVSDAYVTLYTEKDKAVYKICMKEVYPTSIDALELNAESQDSLLEQNITLAYRSYYPIDLSSGESSTTPAGSYDPSRLESASDRLKGTPVNVADGGAVVQRREISEPVQDINDRCMMPDPYTEDVGGYEPITDGVFDPSANL